MYLILTFFVSFDSHDDCFLIPQPTPAPTTAQPTNAPTTAQPTNAPTTAQPTNAPTTAQPTANPTLPPTPAPTNEVRRSSFIDTYDRHKFCYILLTHMIAFAFV